MHSKDMNISPISAGQSNFNYEVSISAGCREAISKPTKVLLRIFGEGSDDLGFDREQELVSILFKQNNED